MENIRSRIFNLLLYTDNEKHLKILEKIKNNYQYMLILHNKDYNENGEIKKEHYHIIIKFDNARYIKSIIKDLEIEENLIQVNRNLKGSIDYLTHKNNKEKYQYNKDEIESNFIIEEKEKEENKIKEIYNYIINSKTTITLEEIINYVIDNELWSYYRRSSLIWIKLIEEHNKKI